MGIAIDILSVEQRADAAVSLFEVKKEKGGELHGLCPFHGEKNPSFSYNPEKDTYNCFSCDAAGDLVDLWCHHHGHDPKVDGLKKFREAFGAEQPPWEGPRQTRTKSPQPPRDPPRSIDKSILENMPELPGTWARRLKETRTWTPEAIAGFHLRFYDKGRGQSRIAIPIEGEKSELLNIRLYLPGADRNKIISWSETVEGKKITYGVARLFPHPCRLSEGRVYLCEGEPDVIAAWSQRGKTGPLNAITQTAGCGTWKDEFTPHFKGREVVICYDADKAGIKGAERVARKLAGVAKCVKILEWPRFMRNEDGSIPEKGGQDLTDFFAQGGTVEEFTALADSAPRFEPKKRKKAPGERPGHIDRFFRERTFMPAFLADALLEKLDVLADPLTGRVFRWSGQFWREWHLDRLESVALDMLEDEGQAARAANAARIVYLRSLVPEDRDLNDSGLVCLENGMVDVNDFEKLELQPHEQKHLCTQILPFRFDLEADCPLWLAFLEELLPDKRVRAQLQQFFGYCLTRETRYAKALLLIGPGSDGKSIILNILQAMIGVDNCSAVQMSKLEDPFERATIHQKLLNVATEEDKKAFGSSWFKAIVTGEFINASFKHKDFFQFRPYAKLAFASNFFPAVADNTHGYYRRLLPIKFAKQFGPGTENPADPHLEEKLLEELPGIFLWSLVGLKLLRERNGFVDADRTDEFMMEYRRHNDHVLTFVEECLTEEEGERVPVDVVYKRYGEFARGGGNYALSRSNFGQALRSHIRLKDGRMASSDPEYPRARAYLGIRLLRSGEAPPSGEEPPE